MDLHRALLAMLLAGTVLLAACAVVSPRIPEAQAISIAKSALAAQGRFYAKVGNESVPILNVTVTAGTAYFDGTGWNVAMHLEGVDPHGAVRKNDVVVMMDAKGAVTGVQAGKIGP